MAVTIASTHYAYPQRDGQAELAWVAWLNTETATHLSTNVARRRVTSLMSPTTLPLSQTATIEMIETWIFNVDTQLQVMQ